MPHNAPKLTPQQIQDKFRIGTVFELSAQTRNRLTYLNEIVEATSAVTRAVSESVGGAEGIAGMEDPSEFAQRATDAMEGVERDNPFAYRISRYLGCPGAPMPHFASNRQEACELLVNVMWAEIGRDLTQHHEVNSDIEKVLRLSLLDRPPLSNVIVRGYNFDPAELAPEAADEKPQDMDGAIRNLLEGMSDEPAD